MKTYEVYLPATMKISFSVEANSKQDAIENAMALDFEIKITGDGYPEIEEFSTHEKIVQGNVFYGVCNEAEAVLGVGEDED